MISVVQFGGVSSGCGGASARSSEADCFLNFMARENVIKMGMEGSCDHPKPQIVYPMSDGKVYMPRGEPKN